MDGPANIQMNIEIQIQIDLLKLLRSVLFVLITDL